MLLVCVSQESRNVAVHFDCDTMFCKYSKLVYMPVGRAILRGRMTVALV